MRRDLASSRRRIRPRPKLLALLGRRPLSRSDGPLLRRRLNFLRVDLRCGLLGRRLLCRLIRRHLLPSTEPTTGMRTAAAPPLVTSPFRSWTLTSFRAAIASDPRAYLRHVGNASRDPSRALY